MDFYIKNVSGWFKMHGITESLNIFIIPPILFLITGVSLGVFSLISGKRQLQNVLFALLCFWYSIPMPVFILHPFLKGNIPLIMTVERFAHFIYIYAPAILVLFSHSLVNKKNKIIEIGAFILSFVITLFVFTDYYIYGLGEFKWGYIVKGGIVLRIFGLWGLVTIIYSLILTVGKLKTDIDTYTRLKLKYIMFGSLTIGLMSLGYLPAMFGVDVYPPANFGWIPLLIMAWGIYRHDVIRINLYTRRRIAGTIIKIFVILVLLMAIPICMWAFHDYSLSYIINKTIPCGLPPLFSFVICIFLTFLSLRTGENRNDSILFSLLMLFYALLSIDIYINSIISLTEVGLRVSRLSHMFVVFIPAIGMHLIRTVTNRNSERYLLFLAYLAGITLLLFSQSSYYLQGMHVYSWGLFAKKAAMFDVMSTVSILTIAYNIIILSIAYRRTDNRHYRHRFLFLLIGFATGSMLSLGSIPAMTGYDIYPSGNFIFIPAILLAIAIFRNNISEMIRFAGKFLYFSVMVAVVFAFFYFLTIKYPDSFLQLYFITSIVTVLLVNFLLKRLSDAIPGIQANKLKTAFQKLSDKLSRVRSIEEVSECVSHSCFIDLGCVKCAVLIHNKTTEQFTGNLIFKSEVDYMNRFHDEKETLSIIIAAGNPLLEYISERYSPIRQDEIENWILNKEINISLDDPLRIASIILPVYFENQMRALLLLGVKSDGTLYSSGEIDFLYQLGINLGPHIENAAILQRLEETLEERTKNLRESEGKYRHFVENANEIIYKSDWRGNFIYSNPAFQRIFEYTNEEICRLNYIDFIPEENRETEFEFYSRQLKNRIDDTIRELAVVTKSGKILWIEQNVKSVKDDSGRIIAFDTIVHDITERKIAEEALRESEERYRYLIENASELIYKTNANGILTYANQRTLNVFGFTEIELLQTNYAEVVHPDYLDELRKTFIKEFIVDKKNECYVEYPCIKKNGEFIWLAVTIRNILNDHGKIQEYSCIGRDITQRKAAEDALAKSQEKYRHIIENANEIIYKGDWNGNIIYSNQAFQNKFEYTDEELLKLNYIDFVLPENRESELAFYSNQLKDKIDKSRRELPVKTKSGKIIWIDQSVKSIKDENGRIIEFDCIVHDITERKAAEDALRKSEMNYQQLMENVSDFVFIVNNEGNFKYINPTVTRLTGIPQEELFGKHFLEMVLPEYRQKLKEFYLKQIIENIETTYTEFPVMIKNGKIVWAGQTVRMIKSYEGEMEFYGVTRDISNIKKAEDDRRYLEEAKTRFFANISHEIRTPLTLMLGPIESVLHGDYGMEVDAQFFKNLHRNTLSLLRLVNNLLDFSKIEAGKMTLNVHEIDIVSFARQYFDNFLMAGKSKNITLDLSSSSESIMLFIDPEKMDKVFMNLLSNSLKFTGKGGRISISFIEDESHCRIVISDTGEGIPGNSIGNIFDRFSQADATSTRKYEGTGIGLALVKELVELHNGSIAVESRYIENHPDNHGSIFTLSLPKGFEHFKNSVNVKFDDKSNPGEYVKDYRMIGAREIESLKISGSAGDHAVTGKETPSDGFKKTILVVDDNEDMRNFMKIILQKRYNVIFAENGEEGVSKAEKSRPDLILTDVMMPVMNGFDMTSIIKNDEKLKTTPVIMLTADTDLMNKVAGLEFGADDYLHKPFNTIELLTRIFSLLKNYDYQQIISRRNDEIEDELEVARLLQQRLLPTTMPEISGYYEHAIYLPMDKIGGDFYDVEERDGFLNLFIADVSGHGLPGAFLATITKIALENITTRASASKVLYLLNNVILRYTVKSNFVTAFFSIIDINTNVMRFASAGHTSPILYRKKNDEFIDLAGSGTPLGWFNDIRIEEKTIQLESGDRIIFYTDGITECNNVIDGMYEEDRLRAMIKKYSSNSPEIFSKELMKELEIYNGGKSFEDDITMVVLDVL